MQSITDKIQQLREVMKAEQLQAFFITGTDPHMSEYLPEYWQERAFISGFTGSAGQVVITLEKAALWTDSRYFLQGASQLEGTGIELMKMRMPETPSISEWLGDVLKSGDKVGVNPLTISVSEFHNLSSQLAVKQLKLTPSADLLSTIWGNRPALPTNPIQVLSDAITGESTSDKLARLRAEMKRLGVNHYFISSLDEIAWLFNIRGTDISYNPVVIAYALVGQNDATLFIDPEKKADLVLDSNVIHCSDIHHMHETLSHLNETASVGIDSTRLNYSVFQSMTRNAKVVDKPSWVALQKALKNDTEVAGFRNALVQDGVALVQFFMWLEKELPKGTYMTEYSISVTLKEFRARQKDFVDESFTTIAGYNGNGAIVHYSPQEATSAQIKPEGILLIDSGGQYHTGTTDITRTIALSAPTAQAKRDYTNVLKGNLALTRIVFPTNTRGSQLDIMARQFLWNDLLDYGHGTGHGIGHFLNVHEGPQSIRKEENPVTIMAGMVMSNEPGIYRSGEYGLRVENLMVVKPKATNEFGSFLEFEAITLYPYDLKLIDTDLLDPVETKQVNDYHQWVYNTLSPHLSKDEQQWLQLQTRPI